MDIHTQVEITQLHYDHLCSLVDQLLREFSTLKRVLAPSETCSAAQVTSQLQALTTQSAHLAVEVVRLQNFIQSLLLEHTGAAEAPRESAPMLSRTAIQQQSQEARENARDRIARSHQASDRTRQLLQQSEEMFQRLQAWQEYQAEHADSSVQLPATRSAHARVHILLI